MNLQFSPEEDAFREEVRQFVAGQLPVSIRHKVMNGVHLNRDEHVQWQRILHRRGWGGPGWPQEFGGTGLFAVTPGSEGVALRDYPMLDVRHAADLVLSNAPATRVGAGDTVDATLNAIDAALDIGLAALCAEAVGIMDASIAATTDYLKTRRQFGQPIGRFQALQHRMADMLLYLEQARSMSYLAAMHCTNENAPARQRSLSAAKVTTGQACRFIAQNMVQLHGGMGMSDELIISHWFKRLTVIEITFGDTDSHLQRFAHLSRTIS